MDEPKITNPARQPEDPEQLLEAWAEHHSLTREQYAAIRLRSMKMNMWPGVTVTLSALACILLGSVYGHDWLVKLTAAFIGTAGLLHVFTNMHHNP